MKLFYGSKTLIYKPTYGEGNPTNDYGLGFYLTPDIMMADLWAHQFEIGFVMTYSVDLSDLSVLRLTEDNDELSALKWITLLVKHRFSYVERLKNKEVIDWLIRHFDTQIDDYDVIIGYRADDSYFNYSIGFVSGEISLETLMGAMKLGKLGLQYALMSKKAFNKVVYEKHYQVVANDDYRDFRTKTLNEYHELLSREDRFKNTFIGELMKKYGR